MSYTSSKIAFPGLGIGEFTLDRVAFTVFGHPIAWYGIIIAFGMLLAILYVFYRTKEYKGIKTDDIIDFALFIVIFGVIGARLYYVITSDYDYSFGEIFAIWEGGLAIYGGIIGGAIAAFVVCKVKKIRFQCFFDMLAPAVMIGQIVGRWGNFVNGEAHGGPTDLPFGMELTHIYSSGYEEYVGIVHPTFLYESLWNLVGFVLLNIFYRKRKFDGQIVLGYLAWYGFGRMLIEGLRTDSLYVGPFRISQVVGLLSFVAATAAMIYLLITRKGVRYQSASYKDDSSGDDFSGVASSENASSEDDFSGEFSGNDVPVNSSGDAPFAEEEKETCSGRGLESGFADEENDGGTGNENPDVSLKSDLGEGNGSGEEFNKKENQENE